ncbi:MAG TPA: Fic family protein [Cytophagales bacterium]|nr:Fic family protein [Cytophagales bacterium]HAA19474.1 Fic family protein [Cytophagales bacterium]HAP59652.1 Fic family protein [Cytophagales bacterium]
MDILPFDRTVPYNHLPLLPLSNEVLTDPEVLQAWGYAGRQLFGLRSNLLRLPNPNMLVNTISLQEAKSSSAIENILTTEDELFKAVSDTVNEAEANPSTKEVLRYREALWAGFQDIRNKQKLDLDTILEVYRKVKDTQQGLRPPVSQVVIQRGDSEFRAGEVVYTPPRGKGVIEEKMNNLIEYLRASPEQDRVDPLLKMAVAHYQFEAIHPFTDGNGRTGRIINLLYLVQEGLLSHPVLYLSKYIIHHKDEYYHRLGAVSSRQDWKGWLLYMMKGVEQTALHTNHVVDATLSQMDATLEYAQQELKWYTKEVNEALFTQPYLKPRLLGEVLGRTSRTTLTKYAQELTRLGILTPKQDGKEVFYMNNDLVRILEG